MSNRRADGSSAERACRVPPSDAQDAGQHARLRLYRRHPDLVHRELTERERRLLHRLYRDEIGKLYRDLYRRRRRPLDGLPEPADDREATATAAEEREQLSAVLARCVERLREEKPASYRLLHGLYFEGRKPGELAEAEGLTPHAISCRLYRIHRMLRAWADEILAAEEKSQGG